MVPLIAWHSAQTYHKLTALRACTIRTINAIWLIICTAEPVALREQLLSYGQYNPVHPCHPHPRWAKGQNDHLFVFREHSCHAWWHHCAANMYWEKRDDKESHDFYHGFTCDGHAVHLFDHQY